MYAHFGQFWQNGHKWVSILHKLVRMGIHVCLNCTNWSEWVYMYAPTAQISQNGYTRMPQLHKFDIKNIMFSSFDVNWICLQLSVFLAIHTFFAVFLVHKNWPVLVFFIYSMSELDSREGG